KNMQRRLLFNTFWILVTITGLIAFNLEHAPNKSLQQQSYERWLRGVERTARRAHRKNKPLPKINLLVTTPDGSLSLSADRSPGEYPKLLRLLHLLREANLFSD